MTKKSNQNTPISRKEFLHRSIGLLGAAVGLTAVVGCGDDDDDAIGDGVNGGANGTGANGADANGGANGATNGVNGATNGGMDAGPTVDMCETDVELVEMHVHDVTVPPEDVEAGEEMEYMLSEVGGHIHTVTVTPEHFSMLAAGETVEIESSTDSGHSHAVTVTCS